MVRRLTKRWRIVGGGLVMVLLVLIVSGQAQTFPEALPVEADAPRTFRLGFTPFPYEISVEAVNYVYERIAEDADIVMHHFDNGVPWLEALNGDPFSANIRDDIALRLSSTPESHEVLLSVTPISISRDSLAPYRGDEDDMPLPAPWDTRAFDHPDTITAYTSYVRRMIETFAPDYVVMGIEVNLLMQNRPDLWDGYVTLHRAAYNTLKGEFPGLPLMVSLLGVSFWPDITEADYDDQMQALADIIDYTDVFAVSMYPFMSAFMTSTLPDDLFTRLADLSEGKPMAISETGFPAQTLDLPSFGLNMPGDETKQHAYITRLLAAATADDYLFIINFVLRDYDQLWAQIGGGDVNAIWRDTGFYDENGTPRPALEAWRTALARPYVAPDASP